MEFKAQKTGLAISIVFTVITFLSNFPLDDDFFILLLMGFWLGAMGLLIGYSMNKDIIAKQGKFQASKSHGTRRVNTYSLTKAQKERGVKLLFYHLAIWFFIGMGVGFLLF